MPHRPSTGSGRPEREVEGRSPAPPEKPRSNHLSGKPIRYYRPRGSADLRTLIDEGFQAFNAARLGEACRIFTEKMLLPEHDTTIGLTVAGALTPAGAAVWSS
jgi:deoxyhypusine synthase